MDRGTDPSSTAVELVTLAIRSSSYFSASRRYGLVSFDVVVVVVSDAEPTRRNWIVTAYVPSRKKTF